MTAFAPAGVTREWRPATAGALLAFNLVSAATISVPLASFRRCGEVMITIKKIQGVAQMNRLEDLMNGEVDGHPHFEASRFFRITLHHGPRSGWYYQAREGMFGPFINRDQAERDLLRLIDKNPSQRLEIYRKLGIEVSKL